MLQINILLFAVGSCGVLAANCPDHWIGYEDSCYSFETEVSFDFFEAEVFCRLEDAHLVHLETYNENDFVKSYLRSNKHGDSWIGLTDLESENVWEWYDTKTVATFTDWAPGEPDNDDNQDCVQMRPSTDYKWDDTVCTGGDRNLPICEKKQWASSS